MHMRNTQGCSRELIVDWTLYVVRGGFAREPKRRFCAIDKAKVSCEGRATQQLKPRPLWRERDHANYQRPGLPKTEVGAFLFLPGPCLLNDSFSRRNLVNYSASRISVITR